MSATDRFEHAREAIAKLAEESFRHHVIDQRGPNEWLCGRRGTSAYYFNVIARPGYLIVHGDIGDWILQHSDRDCVGWLRRAARDYEYLCGKIRAGDKKRFYQGDALDHLNNEIADGNSQAAAVKDALEEDFGEHEWYEAWSEVGVGCNDVMDCRDLDAGPLWLAEAMKWFVAHLPEIGIYSTTHYAADIRTQVRGYAESRDLPVPATAASTRKPREAKPVVDWREAFRSSVMRTGLHLSLTQPMLEFLCATADGVMYDRFGSSSLGKPDHFIVTRASLEKRGLVRPRKDYKFDSKDLGKTHLELTEAGAAVVQLLKVAGVFVEADRAIEKRHGGER